MEDGNVAAAAEMETSMANKEQKNIVNNHWLNEDELELSLGLPSSRSIVQNSKSLNFDIIDDDSDNYCNGNIEFSGSNSNTGVTDGLEEKVLEIHELLDPQAKREAQALRRMEARKKRDEKRRLSSKLNTNATVTTTNNNFFHNHYNSANVNGNCVSKNDDGGLIIKVSGGEAGVEGGAAVAAAGWYEKQRRVDREIKEKENFEAISSCRKGKNNISNVAGFELPQNSKSILSPSSAAAVGNGDGGGGRMLPFSYLMPFWGSNAGLLDCENNKNNINMNYHQNIGFGVGVGVGAQVDAVVVRNGGGGGGFRPYQADKNSGQVNNNNEIKMTNHHVEPPEDNHNRATMSNCSTRDSSGISDHHCAPGAGEQQQGGSSSSDARSHSSHAAEPLHMSPSPPLPVISNPSTASSPQPCGSAQMNPKPDGFLGGSLFRCNSSSSSSKLPESTENNQVKNSNLSNCRSQVSRQQPTTGVVLPQQTSTPAVTTKSLVEPPTILNSQQRRSGPSKKPIMINTQEPSYPLPLPKGDDNTTATMSKPPKPPTAQNAQNGFLLSQMPCVTTTGSGPNGKTITGILYRYTTKTEVSIVCVCHGTSFSPAGFVEHAGGADITHPLRHITVLPSLPF